jgi:hypothetical protein
MSTPLISQTNLAELSTLELAQILASRVAISERDWHRLKSNRQARSLEQTMAALILILKEQPAEAIAHLEQATGWLDHSISAPPCPTHGHKK